MKKILTFLWLGLALLACTSSDIVSELGVGKEDGFATAIASMILSKLETTIQFEDSKLVLDASTTAKNLISAFAKGGVEMPIVLDYKIVNDSVLWTKFGEQDFQEFGVLRKVTNSYDYLQLVTMKNDSSCMTLKLKKQTSEMAKYCEKRMFCPYTHYNTQVLRGNWHLYFSLT